MSTTTIIPLNTLSEQEQRYYAPPPLPVRMIAARLLSDMVKRPGAFQSNGDDGATGAFGGLLAAAVTATLTPPSDPLTSLARVLASEFAFHYKSERDSWVHQLSQLGCDYNPDTQLAAIGAAAEIPDRLWAWKSTVSLSRYSASGKPGYGEPWKYYHALPDGRVLSAPIECLPSLLRYLVTAEPTLGLPDDFAIVPWNWREIAERAGVVVP